MIKKAYITGATSSLGTALIDICISENVKVVAFVNPGSTKIDRIQKSPLVKVYECSLEEMATYDISMLDEDSDGIFFHLAWGATNGEAARSQLDAQAMNIKYALDAVDLASRLGCTTFVGAGSQAEYGRTNEVLTELTEVHPETAYGMAKLAAGQMTRLACKNKNIRHIWPRILSTYGPKYLPYTVINYTISELLNNRKPSLSGGDQIWDFLYSEDAAKALYLLGEKGHDGEVYVVGSGESRPLKEFLYEVRDVINPDLELGLGEKPYTDTTVMHLACDITKLKAHTGFCPETDFKTGIRKTIEWNKKDYGI